MSVSDRFIMDTFKEYCGIKLHFNRDKYIYTSPSQLNYDVNTLLKRNDWKIFKRVAEKFEYRNDRKEFFITQFLINKNAYIGDFLKYDANEKHSDRMKRIDSLKQYVDKDIEMMINYYATKDVSLLDVISTNNDRPRIYKDLKLSLETLSIINNIYPFSKESINPLWIDTILKIKKYSYFIESSNIENIIKEKLDSNFLIQSKTLENLNLNTLEHLF